MRLDFGKYEGSVLLTSNRHIGIWAAAHFTRGSKSTRQAGQLPTTASAHSLELVALASSLRSITNGQAAKLMQDAPRGVTKPRILVVTADPTFADALLAKMKNDTATLATKPLKAGRNFLFEAARQLARFDLTFETSLETDDKSILALKHWAQLNVHSPKAIRGIPASLVPSAVSQIL